MGVCCACYGTLTWCVGWQPPLDTVQTGWWSPAGHLREGGDVSDSVSSRWKGDREVKETKGKERYE